MTTQLRTDVEAIPMDGRVILIGTLKGEVFMSRYIAPTTQSPNGRWPGLATTEWPIAWADVPAHPYFPTKPIISGEKVKS